MIHKIEGFSMGSDADEKAPGAARGFETELFSFR